jgi:hypothetical protein
MIWDLLQQYQIERLDERVGLAQTVAADSAVARRSALRTEDRLEGLALVCCAMFELMRETSGVSEAQLRAKITEIDLRDGQTDQRVTPVLKRCPKCDAAISPHFGRCLFCGHKDDAPNAFL